MRYYTGEFQVLPCLCRKASLLVPDGTGHVEAAATLQVKARGSAREVPQLQPQFPDKGVQAGAVVAVKFDHPIVEEQVRGQTF